MKEFYSFRFPDDDENEGWFAEFLPGPDGDVTLFASQYPHPISETLEEAQEGLKDLIEENSDIALEIVKIELQITPIS